MPKPEQWNASGSWQRVPTIRQSATTCYPVSDRPNQHLVSGRDVEIAHQLSALATTPAKVAALAFVADDLDGEPASSKTA